MSDSTIRGISGGKTASRGGRGGRGRGGAAAAAPAAESSSADEPPQQQPPPSHQQQQPQPASARSSRGSAPFSARGGRGGGGSNSARLTHTSLSGLDASSSTLPSTATSGAGSGAPLSTAMTRQPSNISEISTSSSQAPHPDCLLCCFPIASYTLSTCQHSAQICGTCIVRVQLFIKKGKKNEPASSASASSAAASASASPPPVVGNDLLNDANDFRPSAEALALAESKKWHCPYCQADWSLVLITREYDVHSTDPRTAPPPTSSFGLSTDASKYPLHRWVFDPTLNVYFETEQTRQKYQMMQSIFCVLCFNLAEAFSKNGNTKKRFDHVHFYATTAALEEHLEKSHQRYRCSACVATRKIFSYEHQIFTRKELLHHFQYGSNAQTITEFEPKGHREGVIEPHSWCQFCNKPFFTSDELYVHLTTDHRSCRFCESEGFSRYFRTDAALRAHFATKHYVCEIGACKKLDANHAGFRDQLAGRAHVLAAHADTMSKEQLKKLSTIDLDFFRGGGGTARMAGGSQARQHGPKQIDELEFRPESPPRGPAGPSAGASSSSGFSGFDEYFESHKEDFPSLAGGGGGGSNRSIPRSHSQPMMAGGGSAAQLFGGARREEAFPSLSSSSSTGPGLPLAHASGPGTATETGFRVRGPPPPKSEFPTLHSVAKQDAKQARKAEEKKAQQAKKPQQAKEVQQTKAPSPSPSPPPVQDTRTISSVPLPLPSPAPASELAARNKALVVTVKTALRGDPDSFESFKTLSQRFRGRDISCEKYLQRFHDLFARNPAGAADTERLLMELVALLPDDAQRQELHQEYARQKVMATVVKMKEKQQQQQAADVAASAGPSAASVVAAASSSAAAPAPYAAPNARPIASLGSGSASSGPAPSFAAAARAAPSDSFTVVLSSHDAKDSKAAAKRAAAAQGIGAFEGVAVRPLKRDDDEPTDFLSAIAKETEKREREAAAGAAKNDSSSSKPPPGMKKSGWGDGSAALAGPSGRLPPGLAAPAPLTQSTSSPALSTLSRQNSNNSNSWAALDGENGEEVVAVEQSAGPRKQKARRPATPPSDDEALPISDPPLQSSSSASGPVVSLPEPSELESHVGRISALRIAPREKSSLELLALIFQHVSSLIQSRHGAVNSVPNRRFHMGEQARQGLAALMKQTRWGHALEFSRAARFGLLPASVTLLNSVAGMHSRFGSELLGEQLASTLSKLSSPELFLLLEYTHALLLQLTKPSHPDLKEMQASFAADEARRAKQNEQFKGVPIKDNAPGANGAGAEATPESSSGGGGGGGGQKKKGKQLLYRL